MGLAHVRWQDVQTTTRDGYLEGGREGRIEREGKRDGGMKRVRDG